MIAPGLIAASYDAQAGDAAKMRASLAALGLAGKGGDRAQAEKAAHDFESLFVAQMLEPMFGDSVGTDAFGDDQSADVYKGLMVQEYGKIMAQGNGIGIAQYILGRLDGQSQNALLTQQEVQP